MWSRLAFSVIILVTQIILVTYQAESAGAQNGYWYWCEPARAYYPYVWVCPVQWQAVNPAMATQQPSTSAPPTPTAGPATALTPTAPNSSATRGDDLDYWCRTATLPRMIALCSDGDLRALAIERQRTFDETTSRLSPAQQKALLSDQDRWQSTYPAACGLSPDVPPPLPLAPAMKDCMVQAGRARIAYLSAYPVELSGHGTISSVLEPAISPVQLSALPDTVGIEHSDRINRLRRLSSLYGVNPPQIDELQINPTSTVGLDYPVPVVRIVFPERVFFDFDKDEIRPDANSVLDLIADNMRRDVPDAQVLLLGHTDAIGSDGYNIELSRRRAVSVMEALITRGVRTAQLSTIAIGKRQPIAPNDTEDGRARNRRVEFVISASQAANVELVRRRRIFEEYLMTKPNDVALNIPREVQIEKPTTVTNQSALSSSTATQSVRTIELRKPEPKLKPRPNVPAQYERSRLNDEFEL